MLELYVIYKDDTVEDNEELLRKMLLEIVPLLSDSLRTELSGKELGVIFVTSDEIHELNRDYREKDRPTDILSFASGDPGVVGELVLSHEVVRSQAKDHDLSVNQELLYLLIHGLLHLLGYDHEVDVEAKAMFAIQDDVFESLRGNY